MRFLSDMDPELRCQAGQAEKPTRETCTRHSDHHWCATCKGWYGVPHDSGMHKPYGGHDSRTWTVGCACRPCREHATAARSRIAARFFPEGER